MAKSSQPVEVVSDSEGEQIKSPKKKDAKDNGSKTDKVVESGSADENDEEEEEYEIEAILDAKNNAFPNVRVSNILFMTRHVDPVSTLYWS